MIQPFSKIPPKDQISTSENCLKDTDHTRLYFEMNLSQPTIYIHNNFNTIVKNRKITVSLDLVLKYAYELEFVISADCSIINTCPTAE